MRTSETGLPARGLRATDAWQALGPYRHGKGGTLERDQRTGTRDRGAARTDFHAQRGDRADEREPRLIGTCYDWDGRELNRRLVREGHALVDRRYSLRYIADEASALRRKFGMQASRYVAPWDCRRGRRIFSR